MKCIRNLGAIAKIISSLILTSPMHAQKPFGSFMNKIFFNVYSDNPDSSIHSFVNDFAPLLLYTPPPDTTVEWIAYPDKEITPPVVITHSYLFNRHPFINCPIKQGEFKVFTNVFNDEIYHNEISIKSVQIILEFEELTDADSLFEQCRKDLSAIAQQVIYTEEKTRKVFQAYSDEPLYNIPCGLRIILGMERNINSLYQLNFQ